MKLSKMHKRLLALSAMLPMGAAMAQEAPAAAPAAATPVINAPQLETVTVTAQRRTENIRDVPVSVSLLKDENLDVINSGGGDIRELASRVPSLNIESSNGRTFPRFYIRGYGNTDFSTFASQPVSLIYDDIVQENPILKGFPIFDLADVEVLNGPQGTLFGRNTPAAWSSSSRKSPSWARPRVITTCRPPATAPTTPTARSTCRCRTRGRCASRCCANTATTSSATATPTRATSTRVTTRKRRACSSCTSPAPPSTRCSMCTRVKPPAAHACSAPT